MNGILIALHIVISIFLIISILLQPSAKGGGLGSSFTGGYTVNSAFGARGSAPFLMKLTYWLAASMMITSLVLEIFVIKANRSVLDKPKTAIEETTANINSEVGSKPTQSVITSSATESNKK